MATENQGYSNQIDQEINIMLALDHINIVKLFWITREPEVCLVMELCDLGTLEEYVQQRNNRLSEMEGITFIHQLQEGLNYLNDRNIIHRDLKPPNLLLKYQDGKEVLKICDFGLAKTLGGTAMAHTLCGTWGYMAPEIHTSRNYNIKADLWSVGVIMYRIFSGKTLFNNQIPTKKDLTQVDHGNYKYDLMEYVSDECLHLMEGLLHSDPNQRISFEEFKYHKWWSKLRNTAPANNIGNIDTEPPEGLFPLDVPNTDGDNFVTTYTREDIENIRNKQDSVRTNSEITKRKLLSLTSSEIDESSKTMTMIVGLADNIYEEDNFRDAFVVYVSVMKELQKLMPIAQNDWINSLYDTASRQATKCMKHFRADDDVDPLLVILFKYALKQVGKIFNHTTNVIGY
eukprot:TRINITY_DN7028_c0_g1_i2.p1 TRINITY_DN7028_c0_g1~~TRINITY_DN7028_c0_g1_i2.p1  ORF type:complete len:454 (+),score=90.03 TRINITY_DN7028_c0_g1_i2:165-1364(+)